MEHIPVLMEGFKKLLEEIECPVTSYLDGTFGRGGHASEVLKIFPEAKLIGLDQDTVAIEKANEMFAERISEGRAHFVHGNFINVQNYQAEIKDKLGVEKFSAILLDLGVSSPQLDQAERGFSFYNKGPLDMRMNQKDELTAADIVNEWDEDDLVELFTELGEVRNPFRVVKAIVEDRKTKPFETTTELSGMIERVAGWAKKGQHPATKYFLALRMQVNKELEVTEKVIPILIDLLEEKGRLFIMTFHSLEDRIVKYKFRELKNLGRLVNKKVIQAKWEEKKKNPRARSAKLRVFEKGAANE